MLLGFKIKVGDLPTFVIFAVSNIFEKQVCYPRDKRTLTFNLNDSNSVYLFFESLKI
jgi:hypothetical protein